MIQFLLVLLWATPAECFSRLHHRMKNEFEVSKWQSGGITSFSETCFAQYWDNLPEISSPSASECDITIDPFNFFDRMALGKHIVYNTGGEAVWGANCELHWHFGYMTQLDWQYSSGRLIFQDNVETQNGKLDLTWWSYMNVLFSVACYIGAANAGIISPAIQLKHSNNSQTILHTEGFKKSVKLWEEFWRIDHTRFVNEVNDLKKKDGTITEAYEDATDRLYRHLWRTHTGVINTGIQSAKAFEDNLSTYEKMVGIGWSKMVEILAATNWPLLSLKSLYTFGSGYLPKIKLEGDESLQWLQKNNPREFTTVKSLFQLYDVSDKSLKNMATFWGRLARYKNERNQLPKTLDILVHGSDKLFERSLVLVRVLIKVILPCKSFREYSVWAAVTILTTALFIPNPIHTVAFAFRL